jgi:hypothetical protein
MATQKQTKANRKNAAQPRNMTEAGRQAVAGNALRHGLTSKKVVLPHEDESAYLALRDDLFRERAPATVEERFLVDQLAQNMWRLQRARRVETCCFADKIEILCARHNIDRNDPDLDHVMSGIVANDTGDLNTIRRYETSIQRAFYQSLRELDRLQSERRKKEQPAAKTEPKPAPNPQPAQPIAQSPKPPTPEIRSVSQFPLSPTIETNLPGQGASGI